ncbi:OmpA family protein [Maribacter polysiphoniae]|uniref:OmpA family protein n=2 Tax=Maribacter polysiphoniae TaxID=429344 RepID=A0A316E771_9FLAO|nr:OmpA family protein [Maribacter polysiphoniae]PWK18800.1 OmpA family protein [Maribacter polysiphoniae]
MMKHSLKLKIAIILFGFLFLGHSAQAQEKRLKRPSGRVGIHSVDTFVRESFDLYDKVYIYDSYAQEGKPLEEDDYEALIDTVEDAQSVLSSAPDAITDINGAGILKQGKATLQMNRAKKALKYSIKTAKKLLSEKKKKNGKTTSDDDIANNGPDNDNGSPDQETDTAKELEIYSKFDFVPGDKILMADDFSLDNMGDFPSKWNTNGTGELASINGEKWFKLAGKSIYIPDLPSNLPEDYTIEFDMLTVVDKKTSSQAKLEIWLEDNNLFNPSKNMAMVEIPLCLFISVGFIIENRIDGNRVIRNAVEKDIRDILLQNNHISIAVNGKRFRMWINENKVVDVPRLVPENIVSFKLHPRDIRDGIDNVFINNVKIAQGGLDLRSQLLENGRFSTTGILFNSGSDQIKPESFGVLKQVAETMQQEPTLNLKIIGHTDADGNDGLNLTLSEKRASSVKNALIAQFHIESNRLQTEGKGESEPVDKNTTTEGKTNNRRVEFVKI